MGCVNEAALKKKQAKVQDKGNKIQKAEEEPKPKEDNTVPFSKPQIEHKPIQEKNPEHPRIDTNQYELQKQYQLCASYYKQHDLDNAIIHAERLKQLLKNHDRGQLQKIQEGNETDFMGLIRNIEEEYKDMVSFDEEIKKGGWIQKSDKKGLKISTRYQQTTVGALIESIIDVPFQVFISVLIEMQLYKDYIPYMKVSRQQKQVARNCRIGYAQSHFPIISVRQAFFQGIGYNRLHHNNTLFMYTRSLHNREDLQQKLGYKCQVNKDYVQLQYKYFVVTYEPIDKGRGKVTIAMNVDIKLSFIPMWIQDKVSQDFGQIFFSNLVSLAKKFKGSKWERNVEKNPHLFNFFKNAIDQHFKAQNL